jgi:hypothetical protein
MTCFERMLLIQPKKMASYTPTLAAKKQWRREGGAPKSCCNSQGQDQ